MSSTTRSQPDSVVVETLTIPGGERGGTGVRKKKTIHPCAQNVRLLDPTLDLPHAATRHCKGLQGAERSVAAKSVIHLVRN